LFVELGDVGKLGEGGDCFPKCGLVHPIRLCKCM
jgi:hypothetical protein